MGFVTMIPQFDVDQMIRDMREVSQIQIQRFSKHGMRPSEMMVSFSFGRQAGQTTGIVQTLCRDMDNGDCTMLITVNVMMQHEMFRKLAAHGYEVNKARQYVSHPTTQGQVRILTPSQDMSLIRLDGRTFNHVLVDTASYHQKDWRRIVNELHIRDMQDMVAIG